MAEHDRWDYVSICIKPPRHDGLDRLFREGSAATFVNAYKFHALYTGKSRKFIAVQPIHSLSSVMLSDAKRRTCKARKAIFGPTPLRAGKEGHGSVC